MELVRKYLSDIMDPAARLRYLNALETRCRADQSADWLAAIAAWRLEQQMR